MALGTWSISAGTAPSGLSINSSTGVLSGTPSDTPGTFNFTVRAVSTVSGLAATRAVVMVLYASGPTINDPGTQYAVVGTAFTVTFSGTDPAD